MKKIAIFITSIYTVGGEQRVASVIANELSRKAEVTIYTSDNLNNRSDRYQLSKNINVVHYDPYGDKIANKIGRFCYWHFEGFCKKFPSIVKLAYYDDYAINKIVDTIQGKYDIAIAVSGDFSILLGYASPKLSDTMTVGWQHNSYEAYFEMPGKYYYYTKRACFEEAVRNLDECVVLNEDIAEKYEKNLHISCKVIYNPRSFLSNEKSNLTRKQFIACGRFDTQKGFDLLIESFRVFAENNHDWNLLLVGDGKQKNEIEKKIAYSHLENRISLTGYIDNVKEKMIESSIYLLSSRWEGFPMCVTEAFEIGLPVISYDITAVAPLIKNGEGIKVPAFDTKAFTEAMLKLVNDCMLRCEMGQKAIVAAESISVENIVMKWNSLLDL